MTQSIQFTEAIKLEINHALFVFALDIEAAGEFNEVNKLITGSGKINAAFELTRAIHQHQPKMIINLGSAGSNRFKRGEVVCCTQFIQRDMNATSLGFRPYETPFSNIDPVVSHGIKIEGLPAGICGTGDSFETDHSCTDYDVIDMEAYAFAYVTMKEQVPFLCLKYISDGADGAAAEDWMVQVHHAASAFRKILSLV